VEDFKPDFVFMQVQDGSVFDKDYIAELKLTCPVINYNEDVRDDISWMVNLDSSLTIMTNMDDVHSLRDKGAMAAYMMPTYDESIYTKDGPVNRELYPEVVFIGNKYSGGNMNFPNAEERDMVVAALTDRFGSRFKAYGRGYGDFLRPKEEAEAYRSCRVAVMHNNFTRSDYSSDRLIRALACGAVCVPHKTHITCIDSMHILGCAWDSVFHLMNIIEELLNSPGVHKFMSRLQQREIAHHAPNKKIEELEYLIKNCI
jgi:hypothetical protein